MSTIGWCGLGMSRGFPPPRSAVSGQPFSLQKIDGLL
jgi:hypothetical protein